MSREIILGGFYWFDNLHLDQATLKKKSGEKDSSGRIDPICEYTVPGKNRPALVIDKDYNEGYYIILKFTSSEFCEKNESDVEQQYIKIGMLYGEKDSYWRISKCKFESWPSFFIKDKIKFSQLGARSILETIKHELLRKKEKPIPPAAGSQ